QLLVVGLWRLGWQRAHHHRWRPGRQRALVRERDARWLDPLALCHALRARHRRFDRPQARDAARPGLAAATQVHLEAFAPGLRRARDAAAPLRWGAALEHRLFRCAAQMCTMLRKSGVAAGRCPCDDASDAPPPRILRSIAPAKETQT